MSSQPSASPAARWPPDPAHDAPSVHGQSLHAPAPHFAILTSAIAMSSPPSAPPAPRRPPDPAHDASSVHGQRLQLRDERRSLGSAPPNFLKSKKESYQAYLMPRAEYNTKQPAAFYASSPPLRTRLVFEDEALLAEASSPPHGYATPAKTIGTRFRRATPTGGPPSSCESVVTRSASRKRFAASIESEQGGTRSCDRSATRGSAQRKRATQTYNYRRGLSAHQGHRECDDTTSHVGDQQTSTQSKTHQRSNNGKGKRTSRKKQRQLDGAQLDRRTAPSVVETGSVVPSVSSVHSPTSAPVLFEMYKKRKPQNWQFIQLVCKDEFREMKNQDLRSEHARCAYCIKCNKEIKFEKSCTTYVSKHMTKVHPKDLKQAVEDIEAQKRDQTQTLVHQDVESIPKRSAFQEPATPEEQDRCDELASIWIAKSGRPFTIVNDKYFRKYSRMLNSIQGYVKTIKPWKAREGVEIVAAELRDVLKEKVGVDCVYYSASTDIWTARSKRGFISFTLHYLDENFKMHCWILEIKPLPGKHDAYKIADALQECLTDWGLRKEYCVKFLRDGASNGRKACELLGLDSMSCLAHTLHLIVGAGIVKKKSKKSSTVLMAAATTDNDFEAALDEEACEAVEEFIENSCETSATISRTDLDKLRAVVDKFRKLATFFSHSTKAVDCLRKLQTKELLPQTDCATRWNSTYAMLLRMIEIRGTLDGFFEHVATTGEFSDSTAEQPTAEHWLVIRCLTVLLQPFAEATDGLGGQKYPTLAIAVPVLRQIERKLKNTEMFNVIIRSVGNEDFTGRVKLLMDSVRKTFIQLFTDRFTSKLPEELLWISVLDPRCAELMHLSQQEAAIAKTRLKSAAIAMAKEMSAGNGDDNAIGRRSCASDPQSSAKKEHIAWLTDVFSGGVGSHAVLEPPAVNESLKDKCESEITLYLSDAQGTAATVNPLKWWTKERRAKYPIVAALARKWLGCIATSVPSERAFSQSGNVVTSKRCSLDPEIIRDIMFVGENYAEDDDNLPSDESDGSDKE